MTDELFRMWTARPEWHDRAACKGCDVNLFFPERGGDSTQARTVCAGCPVQADCAHDAIERGERFGVWGGMSTRGRRGARLQPIRHGTAGGYNAHRRRGEEACTECRDAKTRYQQGVVRTRNADLDHDVTDILADALERMDAYAYKQRTAS